MCMCNLLICVGNVPPIVWDWQTSFIVDENMRDYNCLFLLWTCILLKNENIKRRLHLFYFCHLLCIVNEHAIRNVFLFELCLQLICTHGEMQLHMYLRGQNTCCSSSVQRKARNHWNHQHWLQSSCTKLEGKQNMNLLKSPRILFSVALPRCKWCHSLFLNFR